LIRALETATRLTGASSPAVFPGDAGWRRRATVLAGSAAALVVVWILWTFYSHTQPPSIEISSERFTVASGMYTTHVPLSSIESIAIVERLPRIERRTNGFGAGGILRGSFRLEEWGSGRLFINRNTPPFVVVRTRDTFVVVNFDDPSRTRELFGRLRTR
jgi:hypothetical protein